MHLRGIDAPEKKAWCAAEREKAKAKPAQPFRTTARATAGSCQSSPLAAISP